MACPADETDGSSYIVFGTSMSLSLSHSISQGRWMGFVLVDEEVLGTSEPFRD